MRNDDTRLATKVAARARAESLRLGLAVPGDPTSNGDGVDDKVAVDGATTGATSVLDGTATVT